MSVFRSALAVVVVAAFATLLYERSQVLVLFYQNAPGRLETLNNLGEFNIKFQDSIRSCEDILLIEKQHVAILACDPGRERWNSVMGLKVPDQVENAGLWVYDYAGEIESLKRLELIDFASADDFHSLGVAFDQATSTLFVGSHAKAGPRIELFKLDFEASTAVHLRTIEHSLIRGPNSISLINSNEFYVTNDHHFSAHDSKLLSSLETYLAIPTGTVIYARIKGEDIQAKVVANVPYANGLERLNSSIVAVASTSSVSVRLFDTPRPDTFILKKELRVPFFPDNLSVSGGKLLIAGHPHPPTLDKFAHSRHICNDSKRLKDAGPEMAEYCEHGQHAASWVSEWSEEGGLRHLYVGGDYPSSSTAVMDAKRGVGVVSGLYARGILVWRE